MSRPCEACPLRWLPTNDAIDRAEMHEFGYFMMNRTYHWAEIAAGQLVLFPHSGDELLTAEGELADLYRMLRLNDRRALRHQKPPQLSAAYEQAVIGCVLNQDEGRCLSEPPLPGQYPSADPDQPSLPFGA